MGPPAPQDAPQCLALVPSRRPRHSTLPPPGAPTAATPRKTGGPSRPAGQVLATRDFQPEFSCGYLSVFCAWARMDVHQRLSSFALSAVARVPLIVHLLCLLLAIRFLCVASRPQIWVRLLASLQEHFRILCTRRGSEFLLELDSVLLSQISSAASSAVSPMPLPRNLMQHGPTPDVSAALMAAVDSATADLPAGNSSADVRAAAMAGAAFAMSAAGAWSEENASLSAGPPAGTGLALLTCVCTLVISKAGRLLGK